MKMYDCFNPTGQLVISLTESQIDPDTRAAGIAGGWITEREASFDESLADCRRLRQEAYERELPDGDQQDAAWHARRGNPAPQQALDQVRADIKTRFPKPTPPEGNT
jgi:hypothetical protein